MTEAIVYFVASPERGPHHRIYDNEDIQALGGIHAIEAPLEKESYWFARLGEVRGQLGPCGVWFASAEFAKLPQPNKDTWRIGRRNPAFRASELDQYVFQAIFRAIECMLESWKCEQDGMVEAYALKELNIRPNRLLSFTRALCSIRMLHDVVEICLVKYWYGSSWPEPNLPNDDSVIAEYCIRVPVQIRWSGDQNREQKLVHVEVLPLASC
jgi:hypothetical protein